MLLKHWRLLDMSPQILRVDTPNTRQKLLLLLGVDTRVRRRMHPRLEDRGCGEVVGGTSWSHSDRTLLQESSRFRKKGVGST